MLVEVSESSFLFVVVSDVGDLRSATSGSSLHFEFLAIIRKKKGIGASCIARAGREEGERELLIYAKLFTNELNYLFPCVYVGDVHESVVLGQDDCLDFVADFDIEAIGVDEEFIHNKLLQILDFENCWAIEIFGLQQTLNARVVLHPFEGSVCARNTFDCKFETIIYLLPLNTHSFSA